MASVHDAAAAIIERLGTVDNMKLQKLLFFAQGWSLAWRGVPMFDDNLEAWKKGPVVDSVYQTYKRHKWYPISEPVRGDPSKLSDDERHILTAVLDRYGRLNGRELSDITHDNPAWATAWSRRPHPKRSRQVIDRQELVRSLRKGDSDGRLDVKAAEETLNKAFWGSKG